MLGRYAGLDLYYRFLSKPHSLPLLDGFCAHLTSSSSPRGEISPVDLTAYLSQGKAETAASKTSGFVPTLFPRCCDEAEGNRSAQRGVPVWVLCIVTTSRNGDTRIAESWWSLWQRSTHHPGNQFGKQVNITAVKSILLKVSRREGYYNLSTSTLAGWGSS